MNELKKLEDTIKEIDLTQHDINKLVPIYDTLKKRLKTEFPKVYREIYLK